MGEHEIDIRRLVVQGEGISGAEAQEFADAFSDSLRAALAREWSAASGFSGIGPISVDWARGETAGENGRQAGLNAARAIRQGG